NVSSSKPGHILGGCVIGSESRSRKSSLVGSRRQSQHMDHAVASLVLLVSYSGTKYVSSLKCEADRESTGMHSFNLSSEEAVGYKAITRSCRDACVSL
ncbi:hypothetical protein POSPLADRAFT_1106916, partial [Postia placenta MAD-698-R-SB12]